jgi:hypothetical protein
VIEKTETDIVKEKVGKDGGETERERAGDLE